MAYLQQPVSTCLVAIPQIQGFKAARSTSGWVLPTTAETAKQEDLSLGKAAASKCDEESGLEDRAAGIESNERVGIAEADARLGAMGSSLRISDSG
jgi:hypothetical protein